MDHTRFWLNRVDEFENLWIKFVMLVNIGFIIIMSYVPFLFDCFIRLNVQFNVRLISFLERLELIFEM